MPHSLADYRLRSLHPHRSPAKQRLRSHFASAEVRGPDVTMPHICRNLSVDLVYPRRAHRPLTHAQHPPNKFHCQRRISPKSTPVKRDEYAVAIVVSRSQKTPYEQRPNDRVLISPSMGRATIRVHRRFAYPVLRSGSCQVRESAMNPYSASFRDATATLPRPKDAGASKRSFDAA